MTTVYQDRVRHLRLNEPVTFPATVAVKATFAPNAALGGPLKHGSIVGVVGQEGVRVTVDRYTGWIEPNDIAPLQGLELLVPRDVGVGAYRDGVLTWRRDITSLTELQQLVSFVCYTLPQMLSVKFIDPPILKAVSVDVNGVDFAVTIDKMTASVESTTFELQQDRFTEAWGWAATINRPEHRRIQRAMDYFTQAVRLRRVGATPWEFLAEVLLNFGKSLEVLFPRTGSVGSRDAIRHGLAGLGYGLDDIESKFLPVLGLRAHVDVAHESLASFPREDLLVIQRFADDVEGPFRELFTRVLRMLKAGSLLLAPYEDDTPGAAAVATIAKLRALQE